MANTITADDVRPSTTGGLGPTPHSGDDAPPDSDDGAENGLVASVWSPSRAGTTVRRAAGIAAAAAGLAVLGLLAGAPLGLLTGALYTWLTKAGTAHGHDDLLILVTFGPLGALLDGAVLPVAYLVCLLRAWRHDPAADGRPGPGTRGKR